MEALCWHQQVELLLVPRWNWFLGVLFSVLKHEYIQRKYFQFILEMQLNVLYVQNHHLLRFKLYGSPENCQDHFNFLWLYRRWTGLRGFLFCYFCISCSYITYKWITDAMTQLVEDFSTSFRAYDEDQYR